jgi:amino acid transporter
MSDGARERATLSTPKIVFIVVAAAAPLAAIVGSVPLMFARGNGIGVPAAFICAALTLVLFAFGYAALARRVVNTGAFYTYIAHGLGKRVAVVAAFVAVIAYNAQTVGIIGGFGFFTQLGTKIPWGIAAIFAIVFVGLLGYRNVDVSARVLAVLMVLEMALLGLLDVGIIAKHGLHAFPLDSVSPHILLSAGLPIALLFAFSCFIGFESAALYAEETRDPNRSIPRATYAAIVLIGVFYSLTAWAAVGAEGTDGISSLHKETSDQIGKLFFDLIRKYVGDWASTLMGLMVLTSLLAAILATHNAAARYLFALRRERVLPNRLGLLHVKHLSPHAASLTQTSVNLVVVLVFLVAGLDPYIGLASSMIGLGTTGIVLLQAGAAIAVVAYFRRNGGGHWFQTGLAPSLGAVGLITAVVLTATHFSVLTNSSSPLLNILPLIYVVAAVAAIWHGWYLKSRRPDIYAGIAGTELRDILLRETAESAKPE